MTGSDRHNNKAHLPRVTATSLQLTGSHKRTATHVEGDLLVTALADNRKLIEA
jgi:hypothetical protein